MLHNYLKIALRNLLRQKAFSFINLAGLATGMACSILILLWVKDELSYDRFHTHADDIYRVKVDISGLKLAVTSPPLAPAIENELPDVKNAVRLHHQEGLFRFGDQSFEEKNVFYADSNLFQVFSFPLLQGDPHTALTQPDGLLLTEEMARKYFGEDAPLGQIIQLDGTYDFTVVGVLRNIPANSHLHFDFLLPMSFLARHNQDLKHNRWENFDFFTYLRLSDSFAPAPSSLAALDEQINELYAKNYPNLKVNLQLQPLREIHLQSDLLADVAGHGNLLYVRVFGVVAVFILLVACINFMNLATARSARRAKEVGLRKVVGAGRKQLISQFLGESLLITGIAMLLALVLVELALPFYNDLTGKQLAVNYLDGKFSLGLLGITIVTGLLAGSYPALFLSGFQAVQVLKGGLKLGGLNVYFRNGLVVTQFVVSIGLVVGTAVVYNQLHYIRGRNLGYEKENLLYLPLKGDLVRHVKALKTELRQNPATADFTFVSDLPTTLESSTTSIEWEGKDPQAQAIFSKMRVDDRFLGVFGMELAAGRFFSPVFGTDSSNYLVNEKAVKVMGMTPAHAVGKTFAFQGVKGTIIGVLKDFNYQPVHQPIDPIVVRLSSNFGYVVVKAKPGGTEDALAVLERAWQRLNPSYPFDYGFVDQDLARLYQAEERMGTILNVFAFLAIFISCLGLYGLAAFTAEQRTKEIGIRKVLGASVANILGLLSRNTLRLVGLAILLAAPLAWYAMDRWLDNFAYRIDMEWGVFALAGVLALVIAFATVSFQAVKAALMNPVKSLRSE